MFSIAKKQRTTKQITGQSSILPFLNKTNTTVDVSNFNLKVVRTMNL